MKFNGGVIWKFYQSIQCLGLNFYVIKQNEWTPTFCANN